MSEGHHQVQVKRTRSQTTQFVCDRLKAYGLRLNDSSRFARMAATLSPGHRIPLDHPNFPAARRAMHDALVLGFVLDSFGEPEVGSTYRAILQRCISDPLLPEERPERTPGRDAQTELFVGAMLQKAGMTPSFEEPDICCKVDDGRVVGVAVKRPKGPLSVKDNLLAARSQLKGSRIPGVIVLDMSVATDVTYKGFNLPLHRAQMDRLVFRFFKERIVGRLLPTIAADIQTGEALGVVFLNQCVYFEIEAGDFALHNHTGSFSRRNDHIKARLFQRFVDQICKGLPE